VHNGAGVDWAEMVKILFLRFMMDFAFVGGQSLGVFVVVFVGKILFSEEFFVVGFCLEQLLHGKIKFQKNYFFYTIIIQCSTFFD
jgi:hypothetical protein